MKAIIPHCVAAAEMLRRELGAHIIMTVYDRNTHLPEAFQNYELYDHRILFQLSNRIVAIEPANPGGTGRSIQDADAMPCSDASPSDRVEAPRRFLFFGLRKFPSLRHLRKALSYLTLFERLLHVWQRRFCVRRFLRAIRPDIIILAEDNVETLSMAFVNEGSRQGIPSVIIPFTIPNPLEPAKAYRDRRRNQVRGPLAKLVSAVYPKWRLQIDGRDLLRLPASTALVLEMLGQSSPAPWILNRGRAAKIALDSEVQRDTYLKLGFPRAQLSVVGDINGEILHRGLANRSQLLADILARHDFRAGRPLILCGFPPDQYESKSLEFEFESYDDLVRGWMDSFTALGDRANILVRPHPRVPLDRFKAFKAPNVRFTLQPTEELVPLCDLYIASISATIRWAIACGIPVINYDTYRYRYGDYEKASAVICTESLRDFRAQVDRFVNDPSFAASLVERQRSEMRRWGIIDDKLPTRFAALITELICAGAR
jgi:hypothetical protein